ncbi:MAG TPA: hypothetical protein VGQ10_05690 [Vicinamibacterales bacterium]|nr:hypothetical protein [Vicinamibacterales bacterium]
MVLTPGTRLGPYEIESLLGAGGMGEVYRARDTRLDRTVAIKVLPDTLAIDPQFRERLDREARAISQLDHQEADARTDVFAFGVADEMLTGRKACLTVLTRPDRAHGEADRVWPEMLPAGRAVLFTITTTAGGLDAAQVAVLELRPRHTQGARARCYTCARRVQPASRVSLHAIR